MKSKLHNRIIFLLFVNVCMSLSTVVAQERAFAQVPANSYAVPFKGNLELIGNTVISITGRQVDRSGRYTGIRFAPNDDFNLVGSNAHMNMDYVDIDGDASTISSSTSDLALPSTCSKIRYAGLYWSATYPGGVPAFFGGTAVNTDVRLQGCTTRTGDRGAPAYVDAAGDLTRTNTGVRAIVNCDTQFDGNPGAINFRRQDDQFDYRYIKFKPPGGAYIDITPTSAIPSQVLYDGFPNTPTNPFNSAAADMPYVAYADVTSIVAGLADPTGTYTVGNVKAYTGYTDGGGSAGGWALVITYEDPTEKTRFISSYDGYAIISSGGPDIDYSYGGFQTIPNGPVNARFGIATLEGDEGLGGDQLFISPTSATEPPNYSALFDAANPQTNFFNGSITRDGANVATRDPASSNTLGFDLDIFQIANQGNTVLGNNETDVTFRTSTDRDQFATFLNTFAIEVIRPDIRIIKRVEDRDGNPIDQGDGVRLGDELFYVLTVQNIGNDDAINTVITDVIPTNTAFISGTVTVPTVGVTVDDSNPDQLIFDIDNDLVKIGDAPFTIRFKVQVAMSCEDLRDACSEDINNTAVARYEGRISGIVINEDASVFDVDNCENEGSTASNFIIDLGDCIFDYETSLCNGDAVLTAGNNFNSYIWRNNQGVVIGTTQTIIVNQTGVYTVEGVSTDCRNNIETHRVTPLTVSTNSPLLPFADNIVFCPIDGSLIPEMYLCGDESRLIDIGSFINATPVEWERLDTTSCPANPISSCPNTDATCNWVNVNTGSTFTLNGPGQTFPAEGQYRISVVFANTCTEFYYFNVYRNTLDPQLEKRDIICGDPGFVRVNNVPSTGYEFSLDNVTYQPSNEFTGITSQGQVTVYIRQTTGSGSPVSCVFEENITIFDIDTDAVITTTSPTCPTGNSNPNATGSISIQLTSPGNNIDGSFSYQITKTNPDGTIFTSTQTPNSTSILFSNLTPGTYTVEATSFNGICVDMGTAIIADPPTFDAIATLVQDLSCERAEILLRINRTTTGSLSFSLDNFVTTLQSGDIANPDTNPANYFQDNLDGTYSIFVSTAGTYTVSIFDNTSNCQITTNAVIVTPYVPIAFTETSDAPGCSGESNGTITLTVTAGRGAFIYVLYDRTVTGATPADDTLIERATNNTNNTTFTFTGLPSGAYSVGVRDFFGCEIPVRVDLTDPDALTATATATDYTCDSTATITITATGGTVPYNYSIDGVDFTNTTGVFPNLTDGSYIATVRDANNCTFIAPPNPIVIDPLQEVTDLDFVLGDAVCNGSPSTTTVTINGFVASNGATAADITYRIIAPASAVTPASNTTVYTLPQGVTYTFEAVTTTDNCSYTEDVFVPEVTPASVTTQLINDVRCRGNADGSFSFTVVDAANFSYTVTGGPTTVPNGTGTGTTPIIIGSLLAGTYTVTITDTDTGCTDVATGIISEPAAGIDFTFTQTEATCIVGADITITATGGTVPYRYQIVPGTGPSVPADYSNVNPITNVPADAGGYTIYVIDANDCETSQPLTVDAPLALTASVTGDFCYETSKPSSLTVTLTNNTDPVSYTVSYNGGIVGAPQNVPSGTNPFTIPNLIPGTYDIVVTDVRGCPVVIPTQTIAPQLTLSAVLTKDLDCQTPPANEAVITLTPSGGNGTNTYTYTIDTGSGPVAGTETVTPPTFNTVIPGTYVFTVTDAQNCTATGQPVIVTPLTMPTATHVVTNIRCFGDTNGSVTITPADGIAAYTYELVTVPAGFTNPGTNMTGSFTNLIAGNYEYVVSGAKVCPSANIPFTITGPDDILGTVDITPITCGISGNVNGALRFENVTGGTGQYVYTLLDTSSNPALDGDGVVVPPVGPTTATAVDFLNLGFGDYYVRVEDNAGVSGCSKLFGPFNVPTTPFFTVASATAATCADGIISNISISGGEGPFFIRIFPSGPFIPVNNLATGTSNGFGNVDNHQFNANPVTGGPLQVGVPYRFEIRDDSSGCTFIEDIDPVAPPGFTITATGIDELCAQDDDGNVTFIINNYQGSQISYEVIDAITLIAVPGTLVTGVAVPAGGPGSSHAITTTYGNNILATGNYLIRVTETDGSVADPCNNSAPFRIEQPEPLGIEELSRVEATCDGIATVTVRGFDGTPPYTFQEVPVPDAVTPSTVPATFTRGATIPLDTSISLNWDIYVQDANGCTEKLDVDGLILYTQPTLTAVVADACVVNSDGTVTVNLIATGVAGTTFQYSRNNIGFEPNPATTATTYSFDVLPGLGQIFYVRDGSGCIAQSVPIDVFPDIILTAVFDSPSCNNPDGTITATSSGGSGVANHTYVLYDSTGTTPIGAPVVTLGNVFSNVTTGSYIVRVTDTNLSNGTGNCTKDFPISVAAAVIPDLSLSETNTTCTTTSNPTGGTGDSDGTITATLINGSDTEPGTTGYLYELFPGNLAANPIPAGAYTPGPGATVSRVFTGLPTGIYTVRVTSGRGCTDQKEVTIDTPPELGVSAALTTGFACAADNTTTQAQITATIDAVNLGTPGGPPALYSFSIDSDTDAIDTSGNFFSSNGMANGLADNQHLFAISPITVVTTYTIRARDANGCESITTVVVNPLNKPTATITQNIAFTCANSEDISLDIVNGSGDYTVDLLPEGAGVPTGQNVAEDIKTVTVPSGTPAIVNYLLDVPGIVYTFKVTDNVTGCFYTVSHTVAPLDPINGVLTEGDPVICIGSTGSINLMVTGFTGNFTYTTNGPTVVGPLTGVAPTATPINIPGLTGGGYTVTISRGANPSTSCNFTTGTVTVRTPPAALTITASQAQDLGCDPTDNASIQTVTMGGYGGYTYQLEDSTVPGTPYTNAVGTTYTFGTVNFFTNLPAGTYSVVVRDAEGCDVRSNDVIIDPPVPMGVPVTADMTVNCFEDVNGTATVVASGGQGVGSYIFTLTFPNGVEQAPINNGTNTITFIGLVPDPAPYTGTVTDNLGCSAPFSFLISEPDEVEVSIATSNTLTCQIPETVTVTGIGGTGSYEYGISTDGGVTITYGPGNSFDIYEDASLGIYGPGDYTFYVRDLPNGCPSDPSNLVRIQPIPDVSIVAFDASTEVLCFNEDSARVLGTAIGGQGNYVYTLTGTQVNPPVAINFTGGNTDDSTNNYRFPGTFLNLRAGTYTYTVTSGDCGSDSRTFTVTEPPELVVTVTPFDITCNNPGDSPDDKDGRIAINASGGSGEFIYTLEDLDRPNTTATTISETLPFQDAGPANANPEMFEFIMLQAGRYIVRVQDKNGCPFSSGIITIAEPDVIATTIRVVSEVECSDQNTAEIEVTITGGTPPYTISENGNPFVAVPLPANPTDPHIFISSNLAGDTFYNYVVRDSRGCEPAPFGIPTAQGLSVQANLICENDANGLITGYGIQALIPNNVPPALLTNIIYVLDPGTPDERAIPRAAFEAQNNIFSNVGPGDHTVAVQGATCTFTLTPDITVPDLLEITAVVPTGDLNVWRVIVDGGVPFDTTTGQEPYKIYVDGILLESNTFMVDVTRSYAIRVEDSLTTENTALCPATTTIDLVFVDLFIPNYFTPNGDGIYDTWYPENTEFFPDIKVKVFDRYGRLLEQFKGPVKGWDGKYEEKLLPSGDYWYLIELNHDGRNRQFTGHFTLYR